MTLQARGMSSSKNLHLTFNFHTKNIIINHCIPLYLRKSMNKLYWTRQSFQISLIYKDIIFALLFQMLFLLFPRIPCVSNYHLLINKFNLCIFLPEGVTTPYPILLRFLCYFLYLVSGILGLQICKKTWGYGIRSGRIRVDITSSL